MSHCSATELTKMFNDEADKQWWFMAKHQNQVSDVGHVLDSWRISISPWIELSEKRVSDQCECIKHVSRVNYSWPRFFHLKATMDRINESTYQQCMTLYPYHNTGNMNLFVVLPLPTSRARSWSFKQNECRWWSELRIQRDNLNLPSAFHAHLDTRRYGTMYATRSRMVKLSATETGDFISAVEALKSTAIVFSRGFKFYYWHWERKRRTKRERQHFPWIWWL